MNAPAVKVLLVEDNPADQMWVEDVFAESEPGRFQLLTADRLSAGLQCLSRPVADVVLLDLTLPDCEGLLTLARVLEEAPHIPVVVLTGRNEDELAAQAIAAGAQDYLVKGQVDSRLLARSIRYALERQRLVTKLNTLALVDALTGLNNRRGFWALGEQHLKFAQRTQSRCTLLYVDLDDLKLINDWFGHAEGDWALIQVAQQLRHAFRESDILARLAGDEFAALALGAGRGTAQGLASRLMQSLQQFNARSGRPYALSVSFGLAWLDPAQPRSLEAMVAEADAAMYDQKRRRREGLEARRVKELE